MRGRDAVFLVAQRELTQRAREKSFLVSTGITVAIVVLVVVLGALLEGGDPSYTVGATDAQSRTVVEAAAQAGRAVDVRIEARTVADPDAGLEDGSLDAVVSRGRIRSKDPPPDDLVTLLQGANRQVQALDTLRQAGVSPREAQRALEPPPLQVSTLDPVDEDEDKRAGFSLIVVLILYGQLVTYAIGSRPASWRRRPRAWSRSCCP